MNRYIYIFVIFLLMSANCFAQSGTEPETSKPSFDTEIVRKCASLDIEGKDYRDVLVTIKSISPDYFFTDKYKVKIIVEDENGNRVYRKTLNNAYLYIYSNGQIQVGKPKFNQVIIRRGALFEDMWFGLIREKEGIW